jgi:outer membrane protein TolC
MLTQYIEEALQKNFTLQQGLARLKQANLLAQQIVADQYPFLDAKMQGSATGRSDESELDFSESLALNFSWQADLWGRLEAAHQAALLDARAEKEALAELSLALSLEIAQAYYELIEVVLLQELLSRQIETNTAAYDLLVLGFANGTAASTDVLQQKELLSSVKAQLPLLKARHAVLANRLQVLLAHVPVQKNFFQPTPDVALPDLPPLPSLGIPADLLLNRPDLRKLRQEVAAADYRVAEAAAERLPTLKIGGSIGLNSSDMLLSIFAEALSTILDWDQKENTVKRRQAKVEEKMAAWSQACLEAVAEVENSLSQEHEQSRLLVALKEQQQVAEALLEQARHRYQHGQADYLPVLSALVSLQKLEQNLIRQQRVVLNYRLQLYSALGGYLPLPASSSSERHTP